MSVWATLREAAIAGLRPTTTRRCCRAEAVRHRRDEVIERALREFRLLDGLVARLTPDEWLLPVQRPETDDPWTVKDALAHITAHKADFLAELSGASTRPRNVGVHTYNRRIFEAWHDRPVDEIAAWHRSVQQSLVDALRAAPETWFDQERTGPWPAAVDGHSRGHRTRDLGPALRR